MMPDITMCKNELCEKKDTCHRYLAKPSEYQSYFGYLDEYSKIQQAKICLHYWEETKC